MARVPIGMEIPKGLGWDFIPVTIPQLRGPVDGPDMHASRNGPRVIPRIAVARRRRPLPRPAPVRPSLARARSFSANCSLLPMYKIVCGGASAAAGSIIALVVRTALTPLSDKLVAQMSSRQVALNGMSCATQPSPNDI